MLTYRIIASLPDGPPTEFQIFPDGQVSMVDGEAVTVDAEARRQVIERFNARRLDMVVDYEHQTEGGEFASPDGTAPAAGWIKALEDRGSEGLWAKVEWTARAKEYLTNREYRYFSPVFLVSKGTKKLIELLRVALTNAPRLNNIRPIVAKQDEGDNGMEFLKRMAKALGLPETATEEEVMTAVTGRLQAPPVEVVACKEVLDALGLAEASGKSEVVASVHALKALEKKPDLTQEVASLKRKLAERDKDDLVALAMKEGKIAASQKEWAESYALSDPEGFKLYLAKAPVIVPVGRVNVVSDPEPSLAEDETFLKVAKMMGNDPEDVKKHMGK